ncbi:COQ9 family protein [uncultured Ferrovibrio sp.]|jgi:ubiquinone biosynthesis protein COQ9|uniref:COQ9 family protein n=1 Tax=uncultured Ferrovibrio sp. TaxID=1576913 RepID=UPI002608DBC4|nr:COQ9 family protein [uncultured Ferrovibrio sp.]
MNDDHLLTQKRSLLAALLIHVPFDGWTSKALAQAAKDCGYDAGLVARIFPEGAVEALEFWVAETDAAMLHALESRDLMAMKIRERVKAAVMTRLELVAPHREAVRRALTLEALPYHAPRALRQLYRTVDAIWYAAGDTATDFNFYTKRMLLAGVYAATLMHWLDDRSEGFASTAAFLDRRLSDVMRIQSAKGKVGKLFERLPSPLRGMRRV